MCACLCVHVCAREALVHCPLCRACLCVYMCVSLSVCVLLPPHPHAGIGRESAAGSGHLTHTHTQTSLPQHSLLGNTLIIITSFHMSACTSSHGYRTRECCWKWAPHTHAHHYLSITSAFPVRQYPHYHYIIPHACLHILTRV